MFPRRFQHSPAIATAGVAGRANGRVNQETGIMSDTMTLKLAAAVSAGALLALAAMAGTVRPAAAQEFNCRNAEFASERTICGSDRLSALDERMSALYAELKAASASRYQRADIKAYQRQFLDARDNCGRDVDCIRGAYLDQISVLETRLEQAYRRSER
ncbi:MAG: lysozyme inhibitor LprI family protein [Hyphomicrobium sp.]